VSPAITEVPGVRVGHWTDAEAKTGCTVLLLAPEGAVAGVDVRGSAPGTRETDLLRPGMLVDRVHAIALSGGSAFGLAAADGVMRYLRERDIGFPTGVARVPIVPAAVIYDLAVGDSRAHPDADAGYAACLDAERGSALVEGSVGAGTGATCGKLLGPDRSAPGGVGTASLRLPGGATVGALAVVNALGDVVDEVGGLLAGAGAWEAMLTGPPPSPPTPGTNSTLGVIATDVPLTKAQCRKLAELGQDGFTLAIRPVHTMLDGDTVFAVSTPLEGGAADLATMMALGVAATEAMSRAIRRAVSLPPRGGGGPPGPEGAFRG
jgi:L-aminopeptidase/D-esterase-like protein